MLWWKKPPSIDFDTLEINLDIKELRKRARIIVIDDQEAEKVVDLKREGYTIEQWQSIPSLRQLFDEDFDLIILDIRGVGNEFSKDEGFGVLKYLRESGSNSRIIAFSGSTFDITANEFFSQADDTLGKDASLFEWMRKIDDLLREKHSVKNYRDYIRNYCKSLAISDSDRTKLESLIVEAIEKQDKKASSVVNKIASLISDEEIQKSMAVAAIKAVSLGIEAASK